ncbi:MAG: hypothetical protein IJ714_04770, partial [Bacteroidales bacterium]|nr:hypothetical protein [Bacteroidales bacterium]
LLPLSLLYDRAAYRIVQFLDLTILSFIFVTMLYNATNIRKIIDKKKDPGGPSIKKIAKSNC